MMSLARITSGIGYRLNKMYHTRFGSRQFNPAGIDVFEADWDTLVILDACRYDTFERLHDLTGTLEKRISRGSTTNEFMAGNVADRELTDTVYVSATPAIENDRGSATLHAIVNVWKDQWDPELCTVPPDVLTAVAKETAEAYPDKRLVVHYLQPHYPFIGPTGRQFDYDGLETPEGGSGPKFWHRVGIGSLDVPDTTLRTAYEENLSITLPYVEELFDSIEGKTVVTSDHGEMINHRASPVPHRLYGHPTGLYTPDLVEVPWLTHQSGSRRTVVAEDPDHTPTEIDQEIIDSRLSDLGYVN